MERLKRIKGAIFDLDGTLLDSMWMWGEIDRKFLAKRGIELPGDYIGAINAMEFSQAAAYTIRRFHLKETPESLMNEWTQMSRDAYASEIRLKPFAKDYLEALAQRGVRLGVATSSTQELFTPALKSNGVYELFSAFVTTNEVARDKSYPHIYLKAAEKLGLRPSDCAVFEDILTGLRGAGQGGFLTVGVFDACSNHEKDEIMGEADVYINAFSQLL